MSWLKRWPPPVATTFPVLLVVTLASVLWAEHYFELRNAEERVIELTQQRVRSAGSTLVNRLAAEFRDGRIIEARSALAAMHVDSMLTRAALIAPDGRVFAGVAPSLDDLLARDTDRPSGSTEYLQAIGERRSLVQTDAAGDNVVGLFRTPMPAEDGDRLLRGTGVLVLSYDIAGAKATARREAWVDTGLLMILIGASAGILMLHFRFGVAGRLQRLRTATERIGAGGREIDPGLSGSDELAALSASIAEMSRRIESSRAAAQEREVSYRALFDGNPLPTFLVDPETRALTAVNDAAVRKYSYTKEEFEAMTVFDLRPEDEREQLQLLLAGHQGPWRSASGVGTHVTKDGRRLQMDIIAETVEVNGRTMHLMVANDVTQRTEAQAEARRGLELLRATGATARVGGWAYEITTDEYHTTEEAWRVHGLEPKPGRLRDDALPLYEPEDGRALIDALAALEERGEPIDLELQLTTPEGERRWVRIWGRATIENGRVVRTHGTIQDTTERKDSQEALARSESRYRTLTDRAPMAIVAHADGRFLYANQAAISLLGVAAPADLIGRPVRSFVHPDSRSAADQRLKRVGQDRQAVTAVRERLIRLDGDTVEVELSSNPIVFGGKPAVQSVLRDVTEESRTRQAIRRRDRVLTAVNQAAGELLGAPTLRAGMELAVATLGRAFDADRASVMQIHTGDDGTELRTRRAMWSSGLSGPPNPQFQSVPWEPGTESLRARLKRGEPVAGRLQDFDEREREVLVRHGLGALALAPVFDGDGLWGYIGVDTRSDGTTWSTVDVEALAAAARVLGSTIHRDRVVERLRGSEKRLLDAERLAGIGSWEWDIVNDRVQWSDALFKIWGQRPGSVPMSYESYLDGVHPDDRTLVEDSMRAAFETASSFSVQHRVLHASGEIRHVLGLGQVHVDAGVPVRMSGTCQDITERVVRESAIIESQRALAQTQRIARLGGWTHDPETDALEWTDVVSEIFGLSSQPRGGAYSMLLELIHPEDLSDFERARERSMADGTPLDHVHRIVRADGTERWVHQRGSGRTVHGRRIYVGTVQDITERVAAEKELRRVNAQLKAIAENIPGVVYRAVVHPGGTIEYPFSAGTFYEHFDVGASEVASNPSVLFRHLHPDDRERFLHFAAHPREGESDYEFRVIDREGGIRWVRSLSRGHRLEDGRLVRDGLVLDITEQKRLEDQLRQSQKLEAVGQLTGGIAHDFNNLLSIILTNVELLRLSIDDPDGWDEEESLDDILAAARSGADLVKGLLGFSRRADLTFQAIDVHTRVTDIAKLLSRVLPATIDFDVEFGDEPGMVYADPGALQQILMNLVTNARDAMPEGGTLRIHVDVEEVETPRSVSADVTGGRFCVLRVSDSGYGMDQATLAQAFDPFFTTKGQGEGTGLGLGVVHGLVGQHNGFTTVESEVGRGTTMSVYLPELVDAVPEGDGRASGVELVGGRETVLVVDDQPLLRRAARSSLEHLGYVVLEAGSGNEAMGVVRNGHAIDIIVTDVVMPDGGGVELYRQVQAIAPEIPFVFMSGYMDQELEERGGLPPGAAFVPKPYTLGELAKTISEALARGPREPGRGSREASAARASDVEGTP